MRANRPSNTVLGAIALASALAVCALGGCDKPLLAETDERSPFDRYDYVRNQHSDQNVTDEFGHRKPNLRDRLMPKE